MRRLSNTRTRPAPLATACLVAALLALGSSGCVTVETARKLGCVAGTFLKVAADNFGAGYLNDVATLVNLFTGFSGSSGAPQQAVGCQPRPSGFQLASSVPLPSIATPGFTPMSIPDSEPEPMACPDFDGGRILDFAAIIVRGERYGAEGLPAGVSATHSEAG